MRLPLDVKRNLWSTRQSGLLAPRRMNFPIDSLALYLPLWHPELSGSTIVSKDLSAKSYTVTEAVHVPPTHRSFDGTNDKIVSVAALAAPIGSAARTLLAWFYPNRINANQGIVFWGNNAANDAFYIMQELANIGIGNWGGAGETLTTNNPLVANNWYMGAAVFDGITATFYLNAVSVASGARTFNTTSTVVSISCLATQYNFFSSRIGEVLIYSRVLTLQEIQHVYQATKRRYS